MTSDSLPPELANALIDDEPFTEEEEAAVDKAREEVARGETLTNEELLSSIALGALSELEAGFGHVPPLSIAVLEQFYGDADEAVEALESAIGPEEASSFREQLGALEDRLPREA